MSTILEIPTGTFDFNGREWTPETQTQPELDDGGRNGNNRKKRPTAIGLTEPEGEDENDKASGIIVEVKGHEPGPAAHLVGRLSLEAAAKGEVDETSRSHEELGFPDEDEFAAGR